MFPSLLLLILSPTLHALILVSNTSVPLVVTTWATEGFQQATKTALDNVGNGRMYALVEGLSVCEREQCDGTVGYGGSPDENGDVRLDALLVDGPGLKMGAVASMAGIKDAAKVAWAVMNFTKHSMLVGDAATNFAKSFDFPETPLRTENSDAIHKKWKESNCQPNFWKNVAPNPQSSCGPYKPVRSSAMEKSFGNLRKINRFEHDTIGMVVIDEKYSVSAGTSTNGATHKIPGRVGDSPIIGAGAYAVEGVGGAAATGDGDVMMRFLPSYQTVEFMRTGMKPMRATRKTIERIVAVYPEFQGAIVAASAKGSYGAACSNLGAFNYTIGKGSAVLVAKVKCIH